MDCASRNLAQWHFSTLITIAHMLINLYGMIGMTDCFTLLRWLISTSLAFGVPSSLDSIIMSQLLLAKYWFVIHQGVNVLQDLFAQRMSKAVKLAEGEHSALSNLYISMCAYTKCSTICCWIPISQGQSITRAWQMDISKVKYYGIVHIVAKEDHRNQEKGPKREREMWKKDTLL